MLNLHTYTSQGSLESIISVSDLMELDTPVISITDPNLISAIEFYEACIEHNKKPIIGLDAYVSFGHIDMLLQKYGKLAGRLTLIAMNKVGYTNLIRLSTASYVDGFYKIPRIDHHMIRKYNRGLLCLINSEESVISLHLQNNNTSMAIKELNILKNVFKDRLYLELFKHNNKLVSELMEFELPYVGTSHAKYIEFDDYHLWCKYMAINKNVQLQEFSTIENPNIYHYKENAIDVGQLWEIIDRIKDYGLSKSEARLPDLGVGYKKFNVMLKKQLVKLNINKPKYLGRLKYELEVISKHGYINYFLMVKDIIDYCNKELSGYISAGRGSVGGCLVAYLLGITRVDPLNPMGFTMEIPFERFLNSSRKVMPDIDLDFNPKDRQKIIEYLQYKYGENSVKNMLTVTTMGARAAMRDICRVTGNFDKNIDDIVKSFPSDQHLNLDLVEDSDIYKNNAENSVFVEMFDNAKKLEGLPRSYGIHASGIAVSAIDMDGYIPLYVHNKKEVTQYKQDQIEYMGIVKFDILGLNTLQIITDALKIIHPENNIEGNIKWLNLIPLNDRKVYEFLNGSLIAGVFQWDTHNYKTVIQDVKPSNFKELVDLNTLGRTAALISGLTKKYVDRKNRKEEIKALHPLLKDIMIETMELPLYQEQVMQIFVTLANYSQSEADDVRKAIGKKIPELMEKQRVIFNDRCLKNGITVGEAEEIWGIIDKFSKYTWNLGHAITYTRICYETAYLAQHYPKQFYCSCINNAKDSVEAGKFVDALKKRKIKVGKININASQMGYAVKNNRIVPGFAGLKYLSEKTVNQLIEIRGDGFKDWQDFDQRVPKKLINKTALKSLYVAGAFNKWTKYPCANKGISDRLGMTSNEISDMHLNQYGICGRVVSDIKTDKYDYIKDLNDKKFVRALAYVVKIKEIYTKHHDKMAFIQIEDINGRYEVTCFPEVWKQSDIKTGLLYEFHLKYQNGIILLGIKNYKI